MTLLDRLPLPFAAVLGGVFLLGIASYEQHVARMVVYIVGPPRAGGGWLVLSLVTGSFDR